MHYLVVAKVKDYPDVEELMSALTFAYAEENDSVGDWEKIADSLEEFISYNENEINSENDDEDMTLEDKAMEYIEEWGYQLRSDGGIWEKASAHFDFCVLGGRFATDDVPSVTTYNKVCEEYGEVAAFVLPTYDEDDKREYKYDLYYIEEDSCDFEPDDLVYVIDGHN